MNILDKFLLEKKFLIIVISCIDIKLLNNIIKNISSDFKGSVFDITKLMLNDIINFDKIHSDFDNLTKRNNKIFIITPFYPGKLFNIRINYHINISINEELIKKKGIEKTIIDKFNNYNKLYKINKYINYSKYDNNNIIEDDIFNYIINYITYKLEDGNYNKRLNYLKAKHDESKSDEEDTQSVDENSIEDKISELSESFSVHSSSEDDNDPYINKILNKIEQDKLENDIYLRSSKISADELNEPDDFIQIQDEKNLYKGGRKIKYKMNIFKRKIRKKMKLKYLK